MIYELVHNQTLQLLLIVCLLLAAADFVVGAVAAIRSHTWSADYIATWIESHLLQRVFPIVILASVAATLSAALTGFPDADQGAKLALSAAGTTAWGVSLTAFVSYAIESLKSLQDNVAAFNTATKGTPDEPA